MKAYGESLLYTPGPVTVPRVVLEAMARPVVHHRTAEFSAILKDLLDLWQYFFATKQVILPVHTTGRGAMEAVITNMLCKDDTIICICNGKFGTFYANIAELYGVKVHRICTDWEKVVDIDEVRAAIEAHPEARAVTVCHNESTTGLTIDVAEIVDCAKAAGMLVFVDAISSGGCARIDMDAWNVDALVVGSQKGLMCPAGMALAILSDAGWEACERSTLPKYFTNFKAIRKNVSAEHPETPGSTPVSMVYALHQSALMLAEEGREAVFARHDRCARAIRAGLKATGCTLFPENAPDERRSVSLTAFVPPSGLGVNECKNALKKDFGVSIAGGIDSLKGHVLRVGHMGAFYDRDVLTFMACLEAVLMQAGVLSTAGVGIAASLAELKAS